MDVFDQPSQELGCGFIHICEGFLEFSVSLGHVFRMAYFNPRNFALHAVSQVRPAASFYDGQPLFRI